MPYEIPTVLWLHWGSVGYIWSDRIRGLAVINSQSSSEVGK